MHVRPPHLRRRLVAGLLGATVALGGVALSSASPASAAPLAITGGHLDWGVKASFRSYITSPIAHGTITVASSTAGVPNVAPAVDLPVRTASDQSVPGTSTYRFGVLPQGTNDPTTRTASVRSGGVVRFQGHDGLLDVTVSDVRVDLDGDTGSLVADVTSKPLNPTPENPTAEPVLYDDVTLGALDLEGIVPATVDGVTTYADIPATLTEAGVPAFGGFYVAGAALDDVTVAIREAVPAPAAVVGRAIDAGTVRWTISRQVWGQTSLNQCLVGSEGATIAGSPGDATFADPTNGVSFPVADGAYDAATGATELDLDGTVVLGNRAQGNYRIMLADPALTIDPSGNGTLTADVSYSLPPGGPPPASCDLSGRTFVAGGDDVVIATFTGDLAGSSSLTGAFAPHFAENVFSVDPRFLAALPSSLRGHFAVSNGNPNTSGTPAVDASHRKALQPIRVGVELAAPTPTSLELTPTSAAQVTGAEHCVTATVRDELALPLSGQSVAFARSGANGGAASGTTDASGRAEHCYTGSAAGSDTITATAATVEDTATVTWAAPPAPPTPPVNPLQALLNNLVRLLRGLLGG